MQTQAERCEHFKDVPRRVKCRRMVEYVYSMFFLLWSENWSWSHATLDRIRRWETKAMSRLSRFKKEEDDTWQTIVQKLSGSPGRYV